MKKLLLINYDCFRVTDHSMLNDLSREFEVDWHVWLQLSSRYVKASELQQWADKFEHVTLTVDCMKEQRRSFKHFLFVLKFLIKVRKNNYQAILTGLNEDLYWSILAPFFLNRNKTVISIHDVEAHPYSLNVKKVFLDLARWLTFKGFRKFQMFSKTQYDLFLKKYPNKECIYFQMPLKNLGLPSNSKPKISERVNLLMFGNLDYYKGIDRLIKAVEILYNMGIRNLHVTIAGHNYYPGWEENIIHKELFSLDLRSLSDNEIPNLFQSNHFLILPYRQVTQSGPQLLAYNYNLPVVASSIGVFKLNVVDRKTGFLFNNEDENDLVEVLRTVLKMTKQDYEQMQIALANYVSSHFDSSKEIIKLLDFF